MKAVFKKLHDLNEEQLMVLSEAIEMELEQRLERTGVPESAKRRALLREQSYRKATGSTAHPVRATGLKGPRKRRNAA